LIRLDNYLVEKSFVDSRTKAQLLIKDKKVKVDGKIILKPAFKLDEEIAKVEVEEFDNYVSRSAKKLKYFLDELDIRLDNMVALDIGSSTGGFTQVLLEYGAKEVSAVDVGTNQLHKTLRDDKRVLSFESCDIRGFESDKGFDIVSSDVSFISLLYILDDVDRLAKDKIILLFKPQFEVGKDAKRDNKGVVLDKKAIALAMGKFEDSCLAKGWRLLRKSASQVTGKEGNLEYCYYFAK